MVKIYVYQSLFFENYRLNRTNGKPWTGLHLEISMSDDIKNFLFNNFSNVIQKNRRRALVCVGAKPPQTPPFSHFFFSSSDSRIH